MDPEFLALLDGLRARGYTDQMISNWLGGTNPEEFTRRLRQIDEWLTGNFNPGQRQAIINSPTFEDAERFVQTQLPPPGPPPAPTPPVEEPPPAPPDPGQAREDSSAKATIQRMLAAAGLSELADWAWQRYQDGASIDQIEIELYERPEFKVIYPEYHTLAAKGRAYSVAELQAYRKAIVGMFRSAGIPEGFYDTTAELADFAAKEVSIAEMSKRIAGATEAAYRSSANTRAEWERLYGLTSGELIAFWIDPDVAEPLITQRFAAVQIGGAARDTQYGLLTRQEAEKLALQGVDQAEAAEGFNTLARSQELFNPLDAGESQIGREVQLGAAFGGDAEAQQQVERRRQRRVAEFAGGGGFATSNEGIAGVS